MKKIHTKKTHHCEISEDLGGGAHKIVNQTGFRFVSNSTGSLKTLEKHPEDSDWKIFLSRLALWPKVKV